jgi:hypothetical protein
VRGDAQKKARSIYRAISIIRLYFCWRRTSVAPSFILKFIEDNRGNIPSKAWTCQQFALTAFILPASLSILTEMCGEHRNSSCPNAHTGKEGSATETAAASKQRFLPARGCLDRRGKGDGQKGSHIHGD